MNLDAEALALQLAYEQVSAGAIEAAVRRRCELTRAESHALMARLAEALADAALDGQAAIIQRLWAIGFGRDEGLGVGTLQALALQYAGWSKEGSDAKIRKAAEAATKASFDRFRARAA